MAWNSQETFDSGAVVSTVSWITQRMNARKGTQSPWWLLFWSALVVLGLVLWARLSTGMLVEVRGVEPLSEKQSTQAATCLVTLLISPAMTPSDGLHRRPVPISLTRQSTRSAGPAP